MTDKLFSRNSLPGNDENHSPVDQLVGSYRTNSFFELYNQACIKNDLTRKSRTTTSNSLNRSEEDEESSNLNDDDLNFDDLDDFGKEPRDLNDEINSEDSEPDDEEQLDKFDDEIDNQENLKGGEDALISIPINQRFNKQRSNSRTINEDELSLKQYAKSLPVNIPKNWKSFSTNSRNKNRNDENLEDLDWFSVKDNPETIAESIRALAKSVRNDGYELFGDLPSRRFDASEIIRERPN